TTKVRYHYDIRDVVGTCGRYGSVRGDGSGGIAAQRAGLSARLSLDTNRIARTAGIRRGEGLRGVRGEAQCLGLTVLHHQRARKAGDRDANGEIRLRGTRGCTCGEKESAQHRKQQKIARLHTS